MKKNNGFMGSMMALVGAAAVAAIFVIAPVTGQDAPAPGGKGGGGFGGKGGGGKQAVPAGPVPRTADGKPDMSGFWGGVQPGGVTSIEPAAARRRWWRRQEADRQRRGLLEVDLLAQDQGLAHPVGLLEVVPVDLLQAVARLLQVGFLEADLAEVVPAAVAARIPSSIPRMAKFPTRRLLARSPTT